MNQQEINQNAAREALEDAYNAMHENEFDIFVRAACRLNPKISIRDIEHLQSAWYRKLANKENNK